MNLKYADEEKQAVFQRYKNGESVASITESTNIPRSTVYSWIQTFSSANDQKAELSAKNFRLLQNKVARLEGIIEILHKAHCFASDPLQVKLAALEDLYGQYNVHMLCDALQVSRGTFYNHLWRNKKSNTWYSKRREEFRAKIQQIYDDSNQIFGANKVHATMKEQGYHISVEMVREIMRDMGLLSVREGAKEFYEKGKNCYNNRLKQQFSVTAPNQVWVGDVTCFRFKEINYYICAIIDLYARAVVGYKVSRNCSTQLTKSTFKAAFEKRGKPDGLTFHSDRGGNYTSYTYREYLESLHVTQSFSRSGVPYDNAVIESFFSNMKREELYRIKYRSEKEFIKAVDAYIEFYNFKRPHKKNRYKTPMEKEEDYFSK